MEPLTLESSNEEIEERIRCTGNVHCHAAGTCALSAVLDAKLRVRGVQGFRLPENRTSLEAIENV